MRGAGKVIWISLAIALVFLGGSALSEPSQKTSGLGAFIESFLIDEDETAILIDWSWGSAAGNPVNWRTTDIQAAPKWAQKRYGPYERGGEAVLTVDGKDHPELKKSEIPDNWVVTLRGSRAGFSSVTLENMGNSQDLCPLISYYLESLAEELSIEPYRCTTEPASTGVPVYTVGKKGKKKAWLINEYSGGSGGCLLTLELMFDQARADQVECFGDPTPKTD